MATPEDENEGFSKALDDKYSDESALKPANGSDKIADAEKAALGDAGPKYTSDSSNKSSSGPRRFKAKFSKPLIAATAIGGASTIAWFSFISGPGQFIQAAQLLQQFHFTSNEDAADSRLTRIWRYARNPNDPGRRRLSAVGNKLADAMDAKAKANGFEFSDPSPTGRMQSLIVDPALYKGSADEARKALSADGYTDITQLDDGKLKMNLNQDGYTPFRDRKLMKKVTAAADMNRVSGAVATRKIKIRNLIGMGPITYLDDKAKALVKGSPERAKKWNENRKASLTDAEGGRIVKGEAQERDLDGDGTSTDPPSEDAKKVAAAAEDLSKTSITKVKLAKGVGMAGLVTAVGCATLAISKQVDEQSYELIQLPLMKAAMEVLGFAGMIMANEADDDTLEELGYASENFHKEAVKEDAAAGIEAAPASSWTDDCGIKAELGEDGDCTKVPKEVIVNPEKNIVNQAVGNIPGIEKVCDVATSVPGQVFFGAVDILGGGGYISGALSEGVSALFADDILDGILGWFENDPLDFENIAGGKYGSYLNYGAFYTGNENAIGQGGRALTIPEVGELKSAERQELKNIAQEKGIFYRTLDKSNPRSVVASMARQTPDNLSQAAIALFTTPFEMLSNIKTFIPGNAAYAQAGSFDYGLPKYGFSLGELENEEFENPFDYGNDGVEDFNEAKLEQLRKEWGKECFGVEIFEDTGEIKFSSGKSYTKLCDKIKNGDTDKEFTKYRFYILDTITAYGAACYAGDEDTCEQIGLASDGSTPDQSQPGVDSQESAQVLMERIESGEITGDQRYLDQIIDVAKGDSSCPLDADLLSVLVKMSESHTFTISSLNRKCTESLFASGTGSLHYTEGGGHAADISIVDRIPSSGSKPNDITFLNELLPLLDATGRDSQLGQENCRVNSGTQLASVPASVREVDDTCNHIHFGFYP